jgi:hypothetical protein
MMRIIRLNTRNGSRMITGDQRYQFLWKVIQESLRSRRQVMLDLAEELSFFVYRSDNNAILAKGILGFEAAKQKADQIRKAQGLPWSVVKFKAERRVQKPAGQVGMSSGSQNITSRYGQRGRVDYARNYNPSKGRRFRGYTDAQGNYHDID